MAATIVLPVVLRRIARDDPPDRLADGAPILELGPEVGLERPLGAQVALDRDVRRHLARRIVDGRDRRLLLEQRAVLAAVGERAAPGVAGAQRRPQALVERRVVEAALEHARVLAQQLGPRVPRDPFEGGVGVDDPAVGIGDDDGLGGVVDGRGEPGPVGLCLVDRGDVLGHDDRAPNAARLVAERGDEQLELARVAVAMGVPNRHGHEGLAAHHLREPSRHPGRVVGTEDRRRVADDLVRQPAEDLLGCRAPGRDAARPCRRRRSPADWSERWRSSPRWPPRARARFSRARGRGPRGPPTARSWLRR